MEEKFNSCGLGDWRARWKAQSVWPWHSVKSLCALLSSFVKRGQ